MALRVERYLTREMQFCTWCASQRKGWVRVISVGDMVELRKGRNEQTARDAYRSRRRRAIVKHYSQEHPEVKLA
jgi:hypothetical protein